MTWLEFEAAAAAAAAIAAAVAAAEEDMWPPAAAAVAPAEACPGAPADPKRAPWPWPCEIVELCDCGALGTCCILKLS